MSTEVLNGDMANISPFRFTFWQPIKFLNKIQFPSNSQWMMGWYLGIAWDTGDMFTLIVWSEPDGKWQNGQEYTHNVVCLQHKSKNPTHEEEDPKVNEFQFQQKYRTNKCRRGSNEFVYELRDLPEGNEETHDTIETSDGAMPRSLQKSFVTEGRQRSRVLSVGI